MTRLRSSQFALHFRPGRLMHRGVPGVGDPGLLVHHRQPPAAIALPGEMIEPRHRAIVDVEGKPLLHHAAERMSDRRLDRAAMADRDHVASGMGDGKAVDRLTIEHAGRDVIAVGHGGTIKAAVGLALGGLVEKCLSFDIDNCSVTRLDHFAGLDYAAWRLPMVNQQPWIADSRHAAMHQPAGPEVAKLA